MLPRLLFIDLMGDGLQTGFRLGDGNAGHEPAQNQVVEVTLLDLLLSELERNPDLGFLRRPTHQPGDVGVAGKLESGGHDADHGAQAVAEANGLADYARIRMELPGPEPMAENGHFGGAGNEYAEEIGGHLDTVDALRGAGAQQRKTRHIHRGAALENAGCAPTLVFAEGDHLGLRAEERNDFADGEDPAGAGEWQGPQQDRVHHAEHNGGRRQTDG